MYFDPSTLLERDRYKITTGTILPRPIAWVSTVDTQGRPNLAPFSYFTVAATEPLTLIFCPQLRAGEKKDTLRNIEATGEFVVNLTDESTVKAMNLCATDLLPGESEFDWAEVTPIPSRTVSVPRVAEAPVAFECVLDRVILVGNGASVFGTVTGIHLRDEIYGADSGYIDLAALRPVGRLAGNAYARINDVFEIARIRRKEERT